MKPTVAVIGGGVVGSLIARELTKYCLNVASWWIFQISTPELAHPLGTS